VQTDARAMEMHACAWGRAPGNLQLSQSAWPQLCLRQWSSAHVVDIGLHVQPAPYARIICLEALLLALLNCARSAGRCLQVGQRGYYATRQLLLAGRDVVNVSGGWRSYQQAGIAEKLQQAKL
jgi:hypothetical protein